MKRYDELFEERPSKKQDLQKIRKLKRMVKDKTNLVKSMKEKSEFFRLELVNRENNYNKMFNRFPKVGVMDPTKKKDESKPSSRKTAVFREINF